MQNDQTMHIFGDLRLIAILNIIGSVHLALSLWYLQMVAETNIDDNLLRIIS